MESIIRRYIHKFIKWYLINKCGGAFHTGKYDTDEGFYICIYSDEKYRYLQELQTKK